MCNEVAGVMETICLVNAAHAHDGAGGRGVEAKGERVLEGALRGLGRLLTAAYTHGGVFQRWWRRGPGGTGECCIVVGWSDWVGSYMPLTPMVAQVTGVHWARGREFVDWNERGRR